MSEQDKQTNDELQEAENLLALHIKRMLDDYARQHDTMIVSIAVRWREQGDGELVHSVEIKTGR